MKTLYRRLAVGLAGTAIALTGTLVPVKAQAAQSGAEAVSVSRHSEKSIKVYSGRDGRGYLYTLKPGEISEDRVKSVRQPAGCKAYVGIRYYKRVEKSKIRNIGTETPYLAVVSAYDCVRVGRGGGGGGGGSW